MRTIQRGAPRVPRRAPRCRTRSRSRRRRADRGAAPRRPRAPRRPTGAVLIGPADRARGAGERAASPATSRASTRTRELRAREGGQNGLPIALRAADVTDAVAKHRDGAASAAVVPGSAENVAESSVPRSGSQPRLIISSTRGRVTACVPTYRPPCAAKRGVRARSRARPRARSRRRPNSAGLRRAAPARGRRARPASCRSRARAAPAYASTTRGASAMSPPNAGIAPPGATTYGPAPLTVAPSERQRHARRRRVSAARHERVGRRRVARRAP